MATDTLEKTVSVTTKEGTSYAVRPATAFESMQAAGLLVKHLKHIMPLVEKVQKFAAEKGDALTLGLEIMAGLGPIMLDSPHDVFRFFALLSGVEQAALESMDLADFWAVMQAVARTNNLVGLLKVAVEHGN